MLRKTKYLEERSRLIVFFVLVISIVPLLVMKVLPQADTPDEQIFRVLAIGMVAASTGVAIVGVILYILDRIGAYS